MRPNFCTPLVAQRGRGLAGEGLAAQRKAVVGGRRGKRGARGGGERGTGLGRGGGGGGGGGQRLQIKRQAYRTSKKSRVVSAHICYLLEQRANTTGHGVKSRQTRGVEGGWGGRDSGAVLKSWWPRSDLVQKEVIEGVGYI